MKRIRTFTAIGCSLGAGLFGCASSSGDLAPSPVAADVMRDAPLDAAVLVEGDGRREFVANGPRDEGLSRDLELSFPGDVAAPAATENGRVYGLSSYAGLIISDASDAGPTRVEARYPLTGAPFEISVRDGIVLAIVNEDRALHCLTPLDCQGGQQGHVLLLDARTPSTPRLLAERWVPGAITDTYRRADTLYTVSRVLYPCAPNANCWGVTDFTGTVTAIDLTDPLALAEQGRLSLPVDQGVLRAYSFAGDRLYVATSGQGVQVVELEGELRLGPSARLERFLAFEDSLEQGGVLHVKPMRQFGVEQPALQFLVTPDALIPIEPVVYTGPAGEAVEHAAGDRAAGGLRSSARRSDRSL